MRIHAQHDNGQEKVKELLVEMENCLTILFVIGFESNATTVCTIHS